MAAKKNSINNILFGQKLGDMIDILAKSGHTQDVIIVGLDDHGMPRILGNFNDYARMYGALSLAQHAVFTWMHQVESSGT